MTDFKGGGIPTPDLDKDNINFISEKTEFYDDVFVYGKLYADLGGDVQTFSTGGVERMRITKEGDIIFTSNSVSISGITTIATLNVDGNTNLSGMNGSVTKLFTVIPRFQGSFPIEQVEFSYFDPKLEKYKILKSPRLTIDVYDGPTISNPSVNNTNTISPNDSFRFIKINTKLMKINNDEFFESMKR